ncbi:MAG: Asp-tRNA(Asn)/Glu-tRNA(Gln) amidotransferase subunit GatB [Terriglobales bacterium]
MPATETELLTRYEPVIGLEVHVQLNTASKIFCGCSTRFGAPPNSLTCPVCLGLPGSLPVLNRAAVEKAVRASLGLNAAVRETSIFARKNYFYPDLPKGYQISQYDQPLAEHGWLEVFPGQPQAKRIGITRLHLEEDAGKNLHDGLPGSGAHSYVDLNRAGVPLVEIVSEPDLRAPEEAYEYLTRLKEIMLYLEVSDCNMEEGSLRCDANVSLRPRGQEKFGAKVEVKNLNSFRYLQRALEYEIERQAGILDSGGRVLQETRLFQPGDGRTAAMRSKEQAHDYRYFPEPDLAPLLVSEAWRSAAAASLPEMPQAKRERLQAQYGLPPADAQVLASSRGLADYFEQAARGSNNPKAVANWILGDLLAHAKAAACLPEAAGVEPTHIAELVGLIDAGAISGKMAKDVFAAMLSRHQGPGALVKELGLQQISDADAVEKLVDEVIAKNPGQVAQYRAGKTALLAFFVGQVMPASRGQAAPGLANELLKKKLG